MLFQAENYACYIIYDARSLEGNQVGRNMLRDTRHFGIQSSKTNDLCLSDRTIVQEQ